MRLHRNAKLGLAGRYALVKEVERGCSMRDAARGHGVSPATACTWSRRWRSASSEERRTLSCLFDRSSRPHRSPRLLSASLQARICAERHRSGHGPRPIAARLGYDVVHALVDDHSRLAYAEVLADARAATVTGFLERALAFFAGHGVRPRRLMSDNAWSYTRNRSLRELLARHGIRHLTTKPHRPRTNGKVERFIQTLQREWAYGLVYASSEHRRRALPYWLDHYNRGRPHSSLGGRPPISRVQNVCRQNT